jgi:putative DNA primase/helicase
MSIAANQVGPEAAPKFIRPNFDGIPDELKQLELWLLWAAIWNGSKWTKRPIQPSGYGASTTKREHWSSFADVKQAYERAIQCGYVEVRQKDKPPQRVPVGGVGFVFDGQQDAAGLVYAGVDFDKVISEGKIASLAQKRIKRIGSYTEFSVSGTGLHTIVKARPLSAGIAHGGVELYTSGRYFTMTRQAQDNAGIKVAPDAFAALAEELRAQSAGARSGTSSPKKDKRATDSEPRPFILLNTPSFSRQPTTAAITMNI